MHSFQKIVLDLAIFCTYVHYYFTMLRTERDRQSLQNIVNVRNHVALPLMHEEQVYY